METKFAIFDVDCRERTKCGTGFSYRSRVKPIGDKVDQLHAIAKEKQVRIVFTTCCDGRMLKPGESDDILFVPTDGTDTGWLERLSQSRVIYLDKKAWHNVADDIKHVAWDMFLHNGNATRLFRELNIPHWVVFGNGVDLCVSSGIKGIIKAGYKVTILEDVLISSAQGTPETMENTIVQMCELGAERKSLAQFLDEMK